MGKHLNQEKNNVEYSTEERNTGGIFFKSKKKHGERRVTFTPSWGDIEKKSMEKEWPAPAQK